MASLELFVEGDEVEFSTWLARNAIGTGVIDPDRPTRESKKIQPTIAIVIGSGERRPGDLLDHPLPDGRRKKRHVRLIARIDRHLDFASGARFEVQEPAASQRRDECDRPSIGVPIVDDLDAPNLPGTRGQGEPAGNRKIAWRMIAVQGFDSNSRCCDDQELRSGPAGNLGHVDEHRCVGQRILTNSKIARLKG